MYLNDPTHSPRCVACHTNVKVSTPPPSLRGNDQQVVVSTDQGDLYLFNNMEFRCALPSAPDDGSAICTLAAFSKGFVAGGSSGALRVFERSDDPREFFKCLKVTVLCFFYSVCFSPGTRR